MRTFLLVLAFVPLSAAHRPGTVDEDIVIDDPLISYAITGEIDEPDHVSTVTMDMPKDFALPFELLVPHRSAWKDFRPAYAVVAVGLPEPTDEERAYLPKEVPAGMGVYVDRNEDAERDVVFEDVLRRVYWSTGAVALAVRTGPMEIWVWSPDGQTGPFTLGFGVEEDFTGGAG